MQHTSTSKRALTIALALLVALSFLFVTHAQQDVQCDIKITLLQLNDVYQFAPVEGGARGGIARVLSLKKTIVHDNPNTLFLLAGDTISPSVESISYKGAQMIDAWNVAGLDYATFGNHEFDFGPEVLQQRMKESRFGWIAANVIDRKTGKPFGGAQSFVIKEFQGVKIGIFGLVLPDTRITSRPGPDIEFRSPCEIAREVVPQIHAAGAKIVVALTHLSMREDKEVAHCAPVNLIVGGHEHTLLESSAAGTPIFKMTANAVELGRIDLNVKPNGDLDSIDWKVIPVSAALQEDNDFAPVYRKYAPLLAELKQPVGRSSVGIDARGLENRTEETNAGNLVADAYRRVMKAEVALLNGGSIRADEVLGPGRLTMRDVLSILPFKTKLMKIEVTGATLRSALEHGVSRTAEESQPGRFPQVSGIQFSFDASHSAGNRIVDVKINGQPLNESRKYSLALTTFLGVDGGDGYTMFKGQKLVTAPDLSLFDFEALKQFIVTSRVVAPRVEGRIKRLDKPQAARTGCG